MRLRNQATAPIKPVDNGFEGRTDGPIPARRTIRSFLRVWGNILPVSPTTGMYSAILTDMSSGVTPTDEKKVTIADGWATMPATNGWWWDVILLAKGAHVTIPCVGWFSDEDWRVMQALHVVCFAKDTAAY